jgi:ribosomal-protein-alanine N-acetyltransferase
VGSPPEAPRLRTRRLVLTPAGEDDIAYLERHWSDPDVRRWLWDGAAPSRGAVAAIVRRSEATFARGGYGLWTLRLEGSGEPVGACGLRDLDDRDDVEIIYSLESRLWGQALASEAAEAMLRYAFEHLGLERVLGGADEPNVASARVLKKLGMHAIGVLVQEGSPVPFYAVSRAEFV